ncbi:MAG TPA: hypothetical protein VGS58_03505 [Candidatus Sulfopaludibacter sp.]|nr:hypothetical protein [Candidatus Sulfopaludibacter sp.]
MLRFTVAVTVAGLLADRPGAGRPQSLDRIVQPYISSKAFIARTGWAASKSAGES